MEYGEIVKVKVYEGQIRPAGNVLHSVPRKDVTDREMRILRSIHGNDCVVNLTMLGTVDIDEREHYMELAHKYGTQRVERLFGVMLDDFAEWLEAKQEARAQDREVRNHQRETSLQAAMAALNAQQPEEPEQPDEPDQPQPVPPPPPAAKAELRARKSFE